MESSPNANTLSIHNFIIFPISLHFNILYPYFLFFLIVLSLEVVSVFCDRLKEVRKNRMITQEQLASVLGMSRQAVIKYESGERFPDEVTLVKIADFLNVSLDYLLDRNVTQVEKTSNIISYELHRRGLLDNSSENIVESIIKIIKTLIIEFEKHNKK